MRTLASALVAALAGLSGTAHALGPIIEKDLGADRPKLILAPRPVGRAVLAISFNAGAVDDLDHPGLTRLTQQALLVSNQRCSHDKLYQQLFRADASLHTETGIARSAFVLTARKEDFSALASTVLGNVLAPTVTAEGLPRAIERAIRDAAGGASRDELLRLLATTVVDDWRYNNDTLGDRASLEGITLTQVREHLQGPLSPARATVILAGDFDERKLTSLVRAKRGGVRLAGRDRPALRLPINGEFRSYSRLDILAFPITLDGPRNLAAGRLLGAMVDERLLRTLRRAGLGYSSAAFAARMPWLDMFTLVVPGDGAADTAIRQALDGLLNDLRTGNFTVEDVARNKGHVLEALQRADENPEALVAEMLAAEGQTPSIGSPVAAALEGLSLADIKVISQAWFGTERLARLTFSPAVAAPPKKRRTKR